MKTKPRKVAATTCTGKKTELLIPLYEHWQLNEKPAQRIDVTSDGEMTEELKKIYLAYFGKPWKSMSYTQAA